jgi:hypothetical protein
VGLYRIYIDEVGNHDMNNADDPNQRFLSLSGVILESQYVLHTLQPDMDDLKRRFFQTDPDVPVVFHRKEMVNCRHPFRALRDPQVHQAFDEALLQALEAWDYRVITVVLDKKAHRDQYQVWRYHPYHYCLAVMLERFVLFLHNGEHRGDVMVESRGGNEDRQLKDSYERLYTRGTDYVLASRWQERLTSSQLKVRPKSANVAGLQLADLVAHASRREVLLEHGLIQDDREIFGDRISAILRRAKYHRHSNTGRIEGYGKKLLP